MILKIGFVNTMKLTRVDNLATDICLQKGDSE